MMTAIVRDFDPTNNIDLNIQGLVAEEHAAYKQALDRVRDIDATLLTGGHDHPLVLMDEEVIALMNAAGYAAFREGVRAVFTWAGGPLDETDRETCNRCYGHGRLWGGDAGSDRRSGEESICDACAGAGTVARVA